LFSFIQKEGGIDFEEMGRAFNMGIGMILIVPESNVDAVMLAVDAHSPVVMGRVI